MFKLNSYTSCSVYTLHTACDWTERWSGQRALDSLNPSAGTRQSGLKVRTSQLPESFKICKWLEIKPARTTVVIYLVAGRVWTFPSYQAGGQKLILHLEDGVWLPVDWNHTRCSWEVWGLDRQLTGEERCSPNLFFQMRSYWDVFRALKFTVRLLWRVKCDFCLQALPIKTKQRQNMQSCSGDVGPSGGKSLQLLDGRRESGATPELLEEQHHSFFSDPLQTGGRFTSRPAAG